MKREVKMRYAVDIPPYACEEDNEWVNIAYFETKQDAIDYAQKYFGADKKGRVNLVSSL
jgi:hypothetical protein